MTTKDIPGTHKYSQSGHYPLTPLPCPHGELAEGGKSQQQHNILPEVCCPSAPPSNERTTPYIGQEAHSCSEGQSGNKKKLPTHPPHEKVKKRGDQRPGQNLPMLLTLPPELGGVLPRFMKCYGGCD